MTLLQNLTELYMQLSSATKENPVLAAAVSLWGLSVITYFARNIPMTIYQFIMKQITTSLTFNNAGWGGNDLHFNSFGTWFKSKRAASFSRALSITVGEKTTDLVVGPGYGTHFFFFKNRLFYFMKETLPSQASHMEKEKITITMFGRDQNKILELIEEFRYRRPENELNIYSYGTDGWYRTATIKKKDLKTVVINAKLKEEILKTIEDFNSDPEWYYSRGIPYKETFIFHGKPGTGKTSLIRALSSHFSRNVYQLDISLMSGSSFTRAIQSVPAGSFVLIEDFDSASAVKKRADDPGEKTKEMVVGAVSSGAMVPSSNFEKMLQEENSANMSQILNTLDGIVSLDNLLIFLSTNKLHEIDPAIIRKGRVDHIYELKYLEDAEIREYAALMYPDCSIGEANRFEPIAGCDIQDLFKKNKDDFVTFFNSLKRKES